MQNIRLGLSFDDVLLVPSYSAISSRSEIDLSVNLTGPFKFETPIIPANMKNVSGQEMARAVYMHGGLAILHRFMSFQEQAQVLENLCMEFDNSIFHHVGVSLGVKKEDYENALKFFHLGVRIFCIDIAHGDSKLAVDMCTYLAINFPDSLIIAGNVATAEGARRLWKAGAHSVKVGIGPGCLKEGTRILMENGVYKNIEDIIPGEFVINKDGNPVKVTNVFSTGPKKVSKIRNSIWYSDTFVTDDHHYWVGDLNSSSKETIENHGYRKILSKNDRYDNSKIKWKPIGDLKQDVFLMPRYIKFNLPESFTKHLFKRSGGNHIGGLDINNCSLDSTIISNYESGYIFGTFLGDGHAMVSHTNNSSSGAVTWNFGKDEFEIASRLVKCIRSVFNKEPVIQEGSSTLDVVFYYKPLADFLFTFGKKAEKNLPKEFLVSNQPYLKGLYDGLVDSDGHYDNGRVCFTNTSHYLIELFNIVTYLLTGVFPNNQFRGKSAGNLKGANLENFNDAFVARINKSAEKRLVDEYQVAKLLEKTEMKIEVLTYDITVDCDTHSFIANNAIVHNSLCTTRVETGAGVPQLTAVMDVNEIRASYQKELGRPLSIIADGGIKNAGDCVKALCFADMVMVGNLFAGTNETPGECLTIDGRLVKQYEGSSTHKTDHVEGVKAFVPTKGPVAGVFKSLHQGIRSGVSYQGATNLTELQDEPQIIRMSASGLRESHPHDVKVA
jgi:IMP dehydrogenase/GMP reductase